MPSLVHRQSVANKRVIWRLAAGNSIPCSRPRTISSQVKTSSTIYQLISDLYHFRYPLRTGRFVPMLQTPGQGRRLISYPCLDTSSGFADWRPRRAVQLAWAVLLRGRLVGGTACRASTSVQWHGRHGRHSDTGGTLAYYVQVSDEDSLEALPIIESAFPFGL
jgi:hypothetical protein